MSIFWSFSFSIIATWNSGGKISHASAGRKWMIWMDYYDDSILNNPNQFLLTTTQYFLFSAYVTSTNGMRLIAMLHLSTCFSVLFCFPLEFCSTPCLQIRLVSFYFLSWIRNGNCEWFKSTWYMHFLHQTAS